MCITDEEFNAIKETAEYATRKELEKEISNLKLENLKLRGDIVDLKAKNKKIRKQLKKECDKVKIGGNYREMCVELRNKNKNLERLLQIERAKKGRRV